MTYERRDTNITLHSRLGLGLDPRGYMGSHVYVVSVWGIQSLSPSIHVDFSHGWGNTGIQEVKDQK